MVAGRRCFDVLVAAAFDPELAPLRSVLGGNLHGRIGGLAIEGIAVGIGLVAAALGTARALEASSPRGVVLVGTCGAYPVADRASPSIGDVVVVVGGRLADVGTCMQLTQIPQAIVTSLEVNEPLSTGLSAHGLCRVRAATTLGVTVDDGAASRMGHEGFDAEHLEVFAVASACRAARVPFAAVLGVSNRVGSRARDEWREHHHAASANAVQRLVSWLEQGASGLAEAD